MFCLFVTCTTHTGIVPRFCDELFETISHRKKGSTGGPGDGVVYEVKCHMVEIYNEVVRDLLNPSNDKKRGLRVREHPTKGFYGTTLSFLFPLPFYYPFSGA